MLVDIYQSSTSTTRFIAVPTGNPVAFANVPGEPDMVDPQLFLQGTDLTVSNYFVGLDAATVVKQVADHGFALFTASVR